MTLAHIIQIDCEWGNELNIDFYKKDGNKDMHFSQIINDMFDFSYHVGPHW